MQEPFVAGADTWLNRVVADIPLHLAIWGKQATAALLRLAASLFALGPEFSALLTM